jgi:hypothetical protein
MVPIKRNVLLVSFVIGLAYGLAMYFAFRGQGGLATGAFLGLVPLAMGATPLLFVDVEQIKNYVYLLFVPWLSILGVFVFLFATLKEGALCVVVLGAPFWGAALLGTLIAFIIRAVRISTRKRNATGVALMLLPFAVVGVEKRYFIREEQVSVPSTIVVEAPQAMVFEQLAVIEPIRDDEYSVGVFNRLGVPRPIEATADRKGVGGHRVGHFDRGLEFHERITEYDAPRRMTFDIAVDPTQLAPNSTERHALENGYFRFVDATYTVEALGPERSRITLTSRYVAKSSVNAYGELWASAIIGDFQERVLRVLAQRFERRFRAIEVAASPR